MGQGLIKPHQKSQVVVFGILLCVKPGVKVQDAMASECPMDIYPWL